MGRVFAAFRDDPELRVAILTGGGEKFFSAGWDLNAASEGESANVDWGVGGFGGLQELKDLNKPVIAAVNGIACGGGLELMISADIILAADTARFALPEINVGVTAEAATVKLPRRMPYHVAVEFLMTGRWMKVEEAKHWGLVNEVLPASDLMARARELADQLADGPPLIFTAIKDILRRTETLSEMEGLDLVRGLHSVQRVFESEDVKEGTRAFSEKRKPQWQGR
jgi:crotonobetainyl-CoA hydratase